MKSGLQIVRAFFVHNPNMSKQRQIRRPLDMIKLVGTLHQKAFCHIHMSFLVVCASVSCYGTSLSAIAAYRRANNRA